MKTITFAQDRPPYDHRFTPQYRNIVIPVTVRYANGNSTLDLYSGGIDSLNRAECFTLCRKLGAIRAKFYYSSGKVSVYRVQP